MTEANGEHFVSKRDLWLAALIWLGVLVTLGAVGSAMARSELTPLAIVAGGLAALALAAFMLGTFYGTGYTLHARELAIRAGPFRWRVRLEDVVEVRPSRNPLSAPASSLDRLLLRRCRGLGPVLISPLEKERFVRALQEREPALHATGEPLHLVREGAAQ